MYNHKEKLNMKNIFILLSFLAIWTLPNQAQAQCSPDTEPPTPICINDLNVSLGQNGDATVWASTIDEGSTDNCTDRANLIFTFDAAQTQFNELFDMEGQFTRALYVTDEAGNQNSCEVLITVQCAKALVCDGFTTVNLDPTQSTTIHVNDVLEGVYCPNFAMSFSPTDKNDTTRVILGTETFPFNIQVYDVNSGQSCWGRVINCFDEVPVAVANDEINLSLDQSGKAYLSALIVDQGSFSHCGTVELHIKRANSPGECDSPSNEYRDEILFCCKDIGDTVQVIMRVRDSNGHENFVWSDVIVEDKGGFDPDCSSISGYVYIDNNDNCTREGGDDDAEGVTVMVTNGVDDYLTKTEKDGYYKIFAPYGSYDVFAVSPGYYWEVCPNFIQITLDAMTQDLTQDFGMKESISCPLLNVDVTVPRLRRCFTNNASVKYINTGTATAFDARIEVTLDDDLELIKATETYTSLGGNVYEFEVGDVESFASGQIGLSVKVTCDSTELGETKCIEAEIFPDTTCSQPLLWNGADVAVSAECLGDTVRFTVANVGEGNMDANLELEVIEDDVIMFMREFKLDKKSSKVFEFPTNGATFRLNAEEEPTHPFPFMESVALEGCVKSGRSFNTGFINMFPAGAQKPNYDIDCRELIGSYDPNEKTASPEGYGSRNYLEPGNPITYTLFFQNTGTDTAFNIFILDTLSEALDLSTFVEGPSSHPVEFNWQENRAIRFDFKNIMLPDSFVNEPASNGFVQFTITPKEDLPLPTEITNSVGIYFDFNEPVITNTVFHTIDTNFVEISTSTDWHSPEWENVAVSPNPSADWVRWSWDNDKDINGSIEIVDLLGKTVKAKSIQGHRTEMNLSDLHQGHYIYVIKNGQELFARGKVIIRSK